MTKTLTTLLGLAMVVGGATLVVTNLPGTESQPEKPAVTTERATPSLLFPTPAPAQVETSVEKRRGNPRTPVELQVPYLGIEVPIVPVSLGAGGVLTPPSDPQVIGRWDAGAIADDKRGAMLLTGHTVSTGGGALDDLETLPLGETVVVGVGRNSVEYRVHSNEIRSEEWVAENAESLFGQSGRHRLVLVTCEGYDPVTGEYDENVITIGYPMTR